MIRSEILSIPLSVLNFSGFLPSDRIESSASRRLRAVLFLIGLTHPYFESTSITTRR